MANRIVLPATREIVIDAFLSHCRAKLLSPHTVAAYRWALLQLPDPVPDDAGPLILRLGKLRYARESIRDIHRVWRQLFGWLGESGVMAGVPAPRRARRFPRVFLPQELTSIWAACLTDRDRAMIGFALGTGARIGEIWSLRRSNIHVDVAKVQGKSGARMVPLTRDLVRLLTKVGSGNHVWTTESATPLSFGGFQIAFKRVMRRAGISGPKAGPHTLRHTFATEYIRAGGNAFALQELMGHADIESTQIYVHLAARDLVRNIEHLSLLPAVIGTDRARLNDSDSKLAANFHSLVRRRGSNCKHLVKEESNWGVRRSSGCVDLERCRPAAHGHLVVTQECKLCGAIRRINMGREANVASGMDRIEYGPWLPAGW